LVHASILAKFSAINSVEQAASVGTRELCILTKESLVPITPDPIGDEGIKVGRRRISARKQALTFGFSLLKGKTV
jgi:hypothetical protein